MNISNWGTVLLFGVFTVFCYGVVIGVLPRMRGPGARKYAVQAVGMFLAALLTLLTVGAYLNLQNRWYPTLESIFADPHASASTSTYGFFPGNPSNAPTIELSSEQKDAYTNPALRAAFEERRASGGNGPLQLYIPDSAGRSIRTLVWLPASYLDSPERVYPVVLAFPGYPGMPDVYENFVPALDRAVANGTVGETILVVPDVFYAGVDTECVDGDPNTSPTPHTESFLTDSLIPFMKRNLRVSTTADGWATWGYSAGGYCALMLPVRHPDLVGAGVSFAGYFKPRYEPGQQWRSEDDSEYDLARILREKRPAVRLWYFTAADDTTVTAELADATRGISQPSMLSVVTIPAGGHRFDVWHPNDWRALAWLGKYQWFKPGGMR